MLDLLTMTSERPHISKIIPYLRTGEPIPHDEMLAAINEATGLFTDERRREVASSFSPEAGRYLASHDLLPFIKADISDDEATRRISERRSFIERLSNLLPSVIDLCGIREEAHIKSAIIQIDDCSRDFHTVKRSEYSSTQRKKIVRDISAVIELSKELGLTLQRLDYHVSSGFEEHDRAYGRVTSTNPPEVKFRDLQRLLGELRFSSEIMLYKDSIGERAFFVGDNRARTHIVEYAYQMAVQFDAPKFATTPGSDFSILCSLMYELATGEPDESLAGAINKFGRSARRRTIDEEEIVHWHENSDEGRVEREADNFSGVKEAIKSYEAEISFWRSMLASREWDEFEQGQIGFRAVDAMERREEQMRKHGPFLVWASQISPDEGLDIESTMNDYERAILELAVRVGRRARSEGD